MATSTPATAKRARKRLPRTLAVIHADNCTGCEACVAICPVDCIDVRQVAADSHDTQTWCEIDLDVCVGCELCIRIPRKRGDSYALKVCPWDAIETVPLDRLVAAATDLGGPPAYVRDNRSRLITTARNVLASVD